jgi:beta-glucosidase
MKRRSFLTTGAAAVAALGSTGIVEAAAKPATRAGEGKGLVFPQGFLWGSATASYQVEGAVHEEGRGPSIWDTFSHTPGKTHNGDTGDVADDSFHRYKEDIALMKDLGLTAVRFSIAWSRVFPTGIGTPNPQGLDFYNRVLDELHAKGIAPYCTLYHWDLPQALEDKGGWQNHDITKWFADYCGYVAGKLSDRISHFMTMNEMRSFVDIGYGGGRHAPGLNVSRGKLAQVKHHAVLGHGMAVQAIRAAAKKGTKVGLAENCTNAVPAIETPANIHAAEIAFREENAMYMTVVQEGRYTDHYLANLGADAPKFTPEELKIIASPLDFAGLNCYTASPVIADDTPLGYMHVKNPTSYPHMASPWLYIGPESLRWAPKFAAKLWGVKEIYITENGCSADDVVDNKDRVLDSDRVMFLRQYLTQLHRGIAEGAPVKGYFLWSLLDNYEWADGYEKRFGITYVDFKTQKRTPKLSSDFYKNIIAHNSLV